MLPNTKTFTYQSQLANYCRTGKKQHIPGVNDKHVGQYRRLVRSVFDDALENAFPLTRKLLGARIWAKLVDDFMVNHNSASPQVWYMPKSFCQYVSESQHELHLKYPMLRNLMALEWVEIEVYMMEDLEIDYQPNGNLYEDKLVLNPEHKLLVFSYPVHLKLPKKIQQTDEGTYGMAVFRDTAGEVHFEDLAPALIRLLEYLDKKPQSFASLLTNFEMEYQIKLETEQQLQILRFLEACLERQLILGFQK